MLQMDSGGPLSCDVSGAGDFVVAGALSWGAGADACDQGASMYAGFEYHLDWILDNVPDLP